MSAVGTNTRIPTAYVWLGIAFRIGTFLLWPLFFAGIIALCGLLGWAAIESGRYLILIYIAPIPFIGGYICYQGAVLIFQKSWGVEIAMDASQSRYAELWAFTKECASAVGGSPPDNIIVGMAANFYVTQSPILLRSGISSEVVEGRTLYVCAPLLRIMSELEIKAVLAHEFAHFTGNDTIYSTQVAPAYASLGNGLDALGSEMEGNNIKAIVLLLPLLLTTLYYKLFHILNSAISRKRELRCDEIASEVYGRMHITTGLVKVVGYGTLISQLIQEHIASLLNENQIFVNYSDWFARDFALRGDASQAVSEIIGNAMAAKTQASDSHPAIENRLKALNVSTASEQIAITIPSRGDVFDLEGIEVELTNSYTQLIRRQMYGYAPVR